MKIIQDILYHMIDDEPLSDETLKAIEEGMKDYMAGRVSSRFNGIVI